MNYYAGIGSRKTPDYILKKMTNLAKKLNDADLILRSGGANGADSAFEAGAKNKEIFRADDATDESIKLASQFHPNWEACSDYVKKLHGRNVMIILGEDLKTPVKFLVCWTKDGKEEGGTGQALRVAKHYQIKIYNMGSFYG